MRQLQTPPLKKVDEFYAELQCTISRVNNNDIIVVMGDFNAKIGQMHEDAPGAVGKYGFGQRNERGDRLVSFCCMNELYVANTFFSQTKTNRLDLGGT